eukprot:TRINITY_DN42210_c0_g1_i1.p1 TRINITY_DN42210_c0_g1~~TRINITY_DN42210_c0_g1_i1.p1  ORF type:complete len:189 (+),score=49.88 TRINITY_DN42210_c0_g1_i1:25-567(+)
MGRTVSEPLLRSKLEVKEQIRSLVRSSVRERLGPSFETRLQWSLHRKTQDLKQVQQEQRDILQDARAHGEARAQAESPIAAFARDRPPPNSWKQAQFLAERKRKMSEQARKYSQEKEAMQHRLRTREPLFRVSEVQAAQMALAAQAAKRKKELVDEERKRWEHIDDLQRSVINRPLLMES